MCVLNKNSEKVLSHTNFIQSYSHLLFRSTGPQQGNDSHWQGRQTHFEISFISKLRGNVKLCKDVSNAHKQNKDHIWAKLISFPSISAVHSIYYRHCSNEQSVPKETIRFLKPKIMKYTSFSSGSDAFRAIVQQRVHSWKEWGVKERRFQEAILCFNTFNIQQNNWFHW